MWTADDVKKMREGTTGKWTAEGVKNIRADIKAGNTVNINDPANRLPALERDQAIQARREKAAALFQPKPIEPETSTTQTAPFKKGASLSEQLTVQNALNTINSPALTASDIAKQMQAANTLADMGYVKKPEPKPTLLQTVGNIISDPLGSVVRGAEKIDEALAKSDNVFARNIAAGLGDVSSNLLNSIPGGYDSQSGPAIQIREDAAKAQARGDNTVLGQVIRSIPQTAGALYTSAATGGGKVLPFLWSLGQSYGGAYKEARDQGVDDATAKKAALIQGIPQAAIEVSGGFENLLGKNAGKGLLRKIGRTALEESLEEVAQYPFEGLAKKATYAPDTPWFSTKEDAVINPVQMGRNALVGGIAGGLFGGATGIATQGINLSGSNNISNILSQESVKPGGAGPAIQTQPTTQAQQTQPTTQTQQAQQQAAATIQQQSTQQTNKLSKGAELVQKYRQAEQLRQEYEKVRAISKLTPDELTIADNIRQGRLSPENIPQGMNAKVIQDVANAGKMYDQVQNEIKGYNIERKQRLYDTMDSLLADSDNAKDKAGIFLSRETMERNNLDVFGEKAGKRINETVFRPVHENEARRTRFINKYIERVKNLNLTKAESEAVQMLGEGKITENDLPANVDKEKVKNAVVEFRKIYDNLLNLANEILVQNGYKPVEYRKDYFPHFEDPTDPFVKAMKAMGFKVDNITLPTDIAGITHQFRPGKKWFGHFMRRIGENTTYDALEGFERYLYGISDVIYHTYDIQRLRAFETAIRSKYAPDNIKNRIAEIRESDMTLDEQQAAIDALFDMDRGHLGNYVTNLRSYTDNLAGKKSIEDRNMEHKFGRAMYNFFDNVNTQVARNMVGWNISSWLTNFIPLTQAGAGIKTKNLIRAAKDTVMSYVKDDGFVNKSAFLTNRKGTERLTRSTIQKIADAGMAPMQFIDEFTSNVLVRGKYLDNIERGMSHQEAIKNADSFVAGAMGDRSKGSMPTAFNVRNPITKLFTMFQLEVNNQFSFLFKDLPKEAKELGGKWLAATLLKFMVGSYLFNEIYQYFTGRRPTIDPISTVKDAIKKGTPLEAIKSVGEDVLEQTPFVGGIIGGGRLPIQAALPDLMGLVKGETSAGKELTKLLTYLVSPIGGGGQAKKTIEGIQAYNQGASLSNKGLMRFPIEQTPFNRLRTTLFGQYSTPEAREYFDKDRRTLSEKQTQQVMQSEDPKKEYENFLRQRQINRLKDQLEKATSEKEKAEIREQIKELRAAQ